MRAGVPGDADLECALDRRRVVERREIGFRQRQAAKSQRAIAKDGLARDVPSQTLRTESGRIRTARRSATPRAPARSGGQGALVGATEFPDDLSDGRLHGI
jgi:hypothetical protein